MRSAILVASAGLTGLALAHHSTAPFFDTSVTIEVSGTVTSINYNNPHGQLIFDITRYFAWQPGDFVQPYECVDREY